MIFLEAKCLLRQVVFSSYKNKAMLRLTVLPPYQIILKKWDLMSNMHLRFRDGGSRPQAEDGAEPDM